MLAYSINNVYECIFYSVLAVCIAAVLIFWDR